jgi:hypothetical protein
MNANNYSNTDSGAPTLTDSVKIYDASQFSRSSKLALEVGELAWHTLPDIETVLLELSSSMEGLSTDDALKRLIM